MNQQDYLNNALENLGATLRQQPSLKNSIVQKISETSIRQPSLPRAWYLGRSARGLTSLAACLIVVLGIWQFVGTDNASKVFAEALENIRQASTFSCLRTWETVEDGKKYIDKERFMFKEPHLERREILSSRFPEAKGEVTIHDYQTRQRILLLPVNKAAYLKDYRNDFVVDENTGKLKLRELDTSMRERLLQWSNGEVEDRGLVDFQGQSVRLLKSSKEQWSVNIWINSKTKYPVQVVLQGKDGSVVTYSSIQIDTELNDQLFSLEAPVGYQLKGPSPGWPKYLAKINAKLSHLVLECFSYRNEHENQFPNQLSDLTANDISEQVLNNILADPINPGGKPVIRYYQPPADADFAKTMIMHQVFDKWPKEGIVVCFVDGHRSIISDQKRFEQLLPTSRP